MNQAFRRRIAHLRLTPDQFTVMRILQEANGQPVTQRVLTQMMSSDPNTVASLLERMESAGLLERRPHERDGRAHRIQVQAAGLKVYRKARTVALALQSELLSALPAHKQDDFLQSLSALAEACRRAAELSPRQGPLLR